MDTTENKSGDTAVLRKFMERAISEEELDSIIGGEISLNTVFAEMMARIMRLEDGE